jgi:hypothetical protein
VYLNVKGCSEKLELMVSLRDKSRPKALCTDNRVFARAVRGYIASGRGVGSRATHRQVRVEEEETQKTTPEGKKKRRVPSSTPPTFTRLLSCGLLLSSSVAASPRVLLSYERVRGYLSVWERVRRGEWKVVGMRVEARFKGCGSED